MTPSNGLHWIISTAHTETDVERAGGGGRAGLRGFQMSRTALRVKNSSIKTAEAMPREGAHHFSGEAAALPVLCWPACASQDMTVP